MNWYLTALKQYATFSGRARRKEYWFFYLFNSLIFMLLNIIDRLIGIGLLSGLYGIFILIPSIAVIVRRLHDTDRSGWWILIGFIPIVGTIALFILMLFDGTHGDNRFGADPKAIDIKPDEFKSNFVN